MNQSQKKSVAAHTAVEEIARKLAEMVAIAKPSYIRERAIKLWQPKFAEILRSHLPGAPAQPGPEREQLAKKLEHAAHCFYGEQYGDAPSNPEMVEFAAKFAACQLTGYKTEEEEHDAQG